MAQASSFGRTAGTAAWSEAGASWACGSRGAIVTPVGGALGESVSPTRSAKTKAAAKSSRPADPVEEGPDAIDLMLEIVENLSKDYDAVWGSMIKQAMRRVHPDFSEANAGYRNFAELLQDAEREGCVKLEYDERRGNYRVDLLDDA